MAKFKQILSDISGYSVEELTERNTDPIIQPYDCLKAMEQAINYTHCYKSDSEKLKREKCNMCNEEKDCQGHAVCEDCGGRSF